MERLSLATLALIIYVSSFLSCGAEIETLGKNRLIARSRGVAQEIVVNRASHRKQDSASEMMLACRGVKGISTERKVVALTFDDGPSPIYTRKIIKLLRRHGIKATFFVVGKQVSEHPDLLLELHREHHIIANHTYSHPKLVLMDAIAIRNEIALCNQAIGRILGQYPLLFRPPYGCCSMLSHDVANSLGMRTIMWRSVAEDYRVRHTTPLRIAEEILSLVTPGAIIALHDGGGNRQKTVEALEVIIVKLLGEGYVFLTVPELLKTEAYSKFTSEDPAADTDQATESELMVGDTGLEPVTPAM